jgi:recombination protein RecA
MESPHNNFVAEGFVVHNSGKTSFLLAALAGAQREGGVAILAETEQALSAERAVVMGVDLDSLVLLQPGHMEELLVQVETAVLSVPKSAGPILVGWDSIAATPTKKEVEEGLEGGVAMGERARILSLAMRKLPKLISERRCCLVLVNQIRDKLGVVFGDHTTTPGGHAVKFAASIRLQLFSGAAVKSKEGHTGKDVTFLVQKNRLVPPFRKAKVRLNYATGWSNEWSTLEHAKNLELIAEDARGKEALEEARRKLGWSAQPAAVQPMKEVEG